MPSKSSTNSLLSLIKLNDKTVSNLLIKVIFSLAFKSSAFNTSNKTVSAFANGNGGKLIFGISDNDELVGLSDAEADAEKISEIVKTRLNPIPDVDLSIKKVEGKKLIVLEIFSGKQTPYYYDGDGQLTAFVRIGNESVPAQPQKLQELVLKGTNQSYDSLPSKYDFDNLSFTVPAGAVVGIVGPNGAGKTTLFRLIADAAGQTVERLDGRAGGEKPDGGKIRVGETVKLVYVDQMRGLLDDNKTVWEQLSDGLDIIKLGAVDEKGRPLNGAVREVNSRAYCSWFNFAGPDQNKKVGVLSGGERNRLNLGMMLKQAGNVLLLDEPTNDLDVTTIRALEDAIEDFAGCVLCVSHDRWFLDRICTHILAFENNSQVHWFEGNWSDYAEWRRKELGADADRPHKTIYRKMTR